MNYEEALNYILGVTDYEKSPGQTYSAENFDLRRMDELLSGLGNPQQHAKSIHIAGTKGKGSTAAMVSSVIQTAGYKVGLFTSPHLHTFRERIRVNGEMISKQELADIVSRMFPISEQIQSTARFGRLTTFELATALAFMYFREKNADYQVLETGLGGRLDATNVITPIVSVITSISLDHTAVLGNTIQAIAGEKAGIIKPGVPVVSAPQYREVEEVISRVSAASGSRLIQIGNDITFANRENGKDGQKVEIRTRAGQYNLLLPLLGEYQIENAATAIGAIEVLIQDGANIPTDSIKKGIQSVKWPGRLQVLRKAPTVVVDGAHNPFSAKKLREALDTYFTFDNLYVVLGVSSDKDITGIIREITRGCRLAIVVRSQHPRAANTTTLSEELACQGVETIEAPDVRSAVNIATSKADKEDLVCVTGSLFVVGEAIEVFEPVQMD